MEWKKGKDSLFPCRLCGLAGEIRTRRSSEEDREGRNWDSDMVREGIGDLIA